MKLQKFTLILICSYFILSLLVLNVSAKDEWLHLKSKNFNLIGNASEKDIRKVATRLEQFRETFRKIFTGLNLNSPIPTNVVVFKSASAYKPFKPKRADGKIDNFIAGYFQPGEDVNYITLSTEGEEKDVFGTIFHEYVHFMVNTNFGKSEIPPWFNEGLAEYYQTFAIEEDQKVKLGLPQFEHLNLLQQTKLIPLETLFKISNYALHQNGNHSRSIFYAQSWALIHYLMQSGKNEGLGKFLTLSLKDVPQEKAFQEAFQMTYAQMEKELQKYVAQNSYKYQLLTFQNKLVFDNEMQVTSLSEAFSNAYLGDLLYHTNRWDDSEEYLQKSIALDPVSGMANTTLGMVKIRQRKFDEAKTYLEKAIAQEQKNHLALYRYAYLLSREDRDEFGYIASFPADKAARIRETLKKAITANPAFTESYELLAFINLVNNEQLDESVQVLKTALKYQPGNQRYALRIAEIYLRQDKFADAKIIIDKIAQTADEPELKSRAENLVKQISERMEFQARREAAEKSFGNPGANQNGTGGQMILTRRQPAAKVLTPEEAAKEAEEEQIKMLNLSLRKVLTGENRVLGSIQKIECKNQKVTYMIKTADETFSLTSKDFQTLDIITFVPELENVQLACNANIADVNLVLTYKPAADAKSLVRGELAVVEFVPKKFRLLDPAKIIEEEQQQQMVQNLPPSPSAPTLVQGNQPDLNEMRRTAMLEGIRQNLRQPLADEKRETGFIEKIECSNKGTFLHLKTKTQTLVLTVASMQSLNIRAFTPDVEQVRFGCGLKQLDIPVIFIYKAGASLKNNSIGELKSLEFVPKTFTLE